MANEKVLVAKQAVIDEIADKLTNAQSVVVAEYRGLTVDEVTELRRALRAENVELKVYKNKLALRATEACGKQELDEFLTGPNAIAKVARAVKAVADKEAEGSAEEAAPAEAEAAA